MTEQPKLPYFHGQLVEIDKAIAKLKAFFALEHAPKHAAAPWYKILSDAKLLQSEGRHKLLVENFGGGQLCSCGLVASPSDFADIQKHRVLRAPSGN